MSSYTEPDSAPPPSYETAMSESHKSYGGSLLTKPDRAGAMQAWNVLQERRQSFFDRDGYDVFTTGRENGLAGDACILILLYAGFTLDHKDIAAAVVNDVTHMQVDSERYWLKRYKALNDLVVQLVPDAIQEELAR